jgi:hypothetical protein
MSSQVSARAPVKCYSVILIFIETSLGADAKRFISDANLNSISTAKSSLMIAT